MGKLINNSHAVDRVNNTQLAIDLKIGLGSFSITSNTPVPGPVNPYIGRNANDARPLLEAVYYEGRRVIADTVHMFLQNEVNIYARQISNDPALAETAATTPKRLYLDMNRVGSPASAHLNDLIRARDYFNRYAGYYRKLKTAASDWEQWTTEVHKYYETDYVSSVNSNLLKVEYDGPNGDVRNNLYNTLRTYFAVIQNNEPLYGSKAELVKEVEKAKKENARKAKDKVDSIVEAAKANKFYKTVIAIDARINQCDSAASLAENYRKAVSDYQAQVYLQSHVITFNSTTGIVQCRSM